MGFMMDYSKIIMREKLEEIKEVIDNIKYNLLFKATYVLLKYITFNKPVIVENYEELPQKYKELIRDGNYRKVKKLIKKNTLSERIIQQGYEILLKNNKISELERIIKATNVKLEITDNSERIIREKFEDLINQEDYKKIKKLVNITGTQEVLEKIYKELILNGEIKKLRTIEKKTGVRLDNGTIQKSYEIIIIKREDYGLLRKCLKELGPINYKTADGIYEQLINERRYYTLDQLVGMIGNTKKYDEWFKKTTKSNSIEEVLKYLSKNLSKVS